MVEMWRESFVIYLLVFNSFTHRLLIILNRVENKIRTNTTAETKKGQGSLFVSMRKRLQPEPTLAKTSASGDTNTSSTDAVTPYLKDPSEEMTQSDDSCWAGICAIFGTEAKKPETLQVASPTSVSCQDIVSADGSCSPSLRTALAAGGKGGP